MGDGLDLRNAPRSIRQPGCGAVLHQQLAAFRIVVCEFVELARQALLQKTLDGRAEGGGVPRRGVRGVGPVLLAPRVVADVVEEFGPWHFDRIRRRLVSAARVETLSAQEFDLLDTLTRNPGVTFGRARLSEIVGRGELRPGDRTIDVLIGRLRKKIEADPAQPEFLLTRMGEGYVFAGFAKG